MLERRFITTRKHLCDHCKDSKNSVTAINGGVIVGRLGGIKTTLAYVHQSCKEAWAKNRGGTTFHALQWPSLEKAMQCSKCGKAFEIVGSRGNETEERAEGIRCPYDDCGEPTEVTWPKNQPFFVRGIPSEV
jgi:hypothetical protein